MGVLHIYGFDGTPRDVLRRLVVERGQRLSTYFGGVRLEDAEIPLTPEAFDVGRQQYDATALLRELDRCVPAGDHAVALADADLFVDPLNFVFGLARPGGHAIVALPRLRQSFYGLEDDQDLFFLRVAKEVFHELGHVLGLRHCRNRCVMRFSNSLGDTDRKPEEYCESCLRAIIGGIHAR